MSRHRKPQIFITALLFLTVGACSSNSDEQQASQADVIRVIDGDTIVIAGDERVRPIGIDTPEKGQCGFEEAKQALEKLLASGPATFYSGTTSDKDKYDRLLRYIEVEGIDVGLNLISNGFAIARYDSRDGYGPHDRESEYITADENSTAAVNCN
jgi:endonuclease YncB( thermonuclease family)